MAGWRAAVMHIAGYSECSIVHGGRGASNPVIAVHLSARQRKAATRPPVRRRRGERYQASGRSPWSLKKQSFLPRPQNLRYRSSPKLVLVREEYMKRLQRAFNGSAPTVQPGFSEAFCSLSQVSRGWKYSTMAEASIWSSPVIALRVSCQGREAPAASIASSLSPAAF